MSPKNTNSTYTRSRIAEKDRCRFTSAHGRRCLNPLRSSTGGFCIIHERLYAKSSDAEVTAVSEQLLSGGPELLTREDVGRVMAQLFTLIAQKRIRRSEGSLLAYIGALLLQTMGHAAVEPPNRSTIVFDMPAPAREHEYEAEQRRLAQLQPNPNRRFPNHS